MKKIRISPLSLLLAIVSLLIVLSCGKIHAQTIITEHADGTMTTNVLPNTTSSFSSIGDFLGALGISSNPTNYALATGAGFGKSGQVSAWAVITMNVNNYVGTVIGIDHLWYGGKTGSANIVSGGLNLSVATHPLQWFSSDTNGWAYNFKATPFALAMVGSPINGTSNDGGLCAINRIGVNADIYNIKGWELGALVDYGNRVGAGQYSGSWIDVGLSIRKGF
jgi:hypothetical protein